MDISSREFWDESGSLVMPFVQMALKYGLMGDIDLHSILQHRLNDGPSPPSSDHPASSMDVGMWAEHAEWLVWRRPARLLGQSYPFQPHWVCR